MTSITLDAVGHAYGGSVRALERASIHFEDARTYALLGPSGCGKTTMLNIISGLLTPSEGRVLLGERDVTLVKTAQRNIAQVFQFPVIYRSKSVFQNLAFPLLCRGWDRRRIEARVAAVAEILGLTSRLGQSARALNADEKQLVSLGRGLVRDDVAALLMDEPLTVIDPQLKLELRRRIKEANLRTRHTIIYVTHDQNEAMTFADEVLVMSTGKVLQRGTPEQLFERPADSFVGTFIGSPGMNFLPAEQRGADVFLGDMRILSGMAQSAKAAELRIGIRPEHVRLVAGQARGIPATVHNVQDHGPVRIIEFGAFGQTIRMKQPREEAVPAGEVRIWFAENKIRFYRNGRLADHPPA